MTLACFIMVRLAGLFAGRLAGWLANLPVLLLWWLVILQNSESAPSDTACNITQLKKTQTYKKTLKVQRFFIKIYRVNARYLTLPVITHQNLIKPYKTNGFWYIFMNNLIKLIVFGTF